MLTKLKSFNLKNNIKTPGQFSDKETIQKILNGEIAFFELLIRRYNPVLYKIGRSYGYGHQDVEDLMQTTFTTAYFKLAQFKGQSSFQTWIIQIMLNYCYQKKKKFGFKNEIPSDEINKEKSIPMFSNQKYTNPDGIVANRELSHIIEQAISKIPLEYKLVFSLREINGLSVSETATSLELSESNVKVRLNRAKSMLRKQIEQLYSPEDIFEFKATYCDSMVHNVMKEIKKLEKQLIL